MPEKFRTLLSLRLAACVAGIAWVGGEANAAQIAYWKFNEPSGTTVLDSSGSSRNGNFVATREPTRITGRFDGALDFDAASTTNGDLVSVSADTELRLNAAFTISFWYRSDYVPAASTFPGIVRFGDSQSATATADAGWGIFRTSSQLFSTKRANDQNSLGTTVVGVGAWTHIALRYDNAGNNVAYINGIGTSFTRSWADVADTYGLELGRMDHYDNAGLDDMALYNEDLGAAKVRSLYTASTALGLSYDLSEMSQLWTIHQNGTGSSGIVDGLTWSFTDSLPGSTTAGDSYSSGGNYYVVLGSGTGVTAVPEPSAVIAAGAGAGLLALRRRRRA